MIDLTPRPIGRPRSCHCGECRKCKQADYMRAWWQRKTLEERRTHIARRDPERVAAYERARALTQAKQDAITRSQKRHPERHLARQAVRRAVKRGALLRQRCYCGNPQAEAHHPDYSKPLEVVWLCRRHHSDLHMALNAA